MVKKRARTRRSPRVSRGRARKVVDRSGETQPSASFPIVGIGASAGGLEAFTQLLGALPLDTGMGFVLVQHLDPDHQSALAQILARATSLPVREITQDEPVQPNHVYIIPRNTNLSIAAGVLQLQQRPQTRSPQRSIDFFFESLAEDRGPRAVGVVLSGSANDGTLGLEAIKAEGGITFAQDGSAKYDSMPRSAIAAGCVDLVASPVEIARELARIAAHPFVAGQAPHFEPEAASESKRAQGRRPARRPTEGEKLGTAEASLSAYRRILLLLSNHSGVDFSLYKPATIHRRIGRRLVLNQKNTLADYAELLRGDTKELDALYADVLISVTSFFRNPETFDVLQDQVLPTLLARRGDETLRCWVLGCSTGQEPYSIAMAFLDAAEKAPRMRRLQIFATDVNDAMLDKARQGLYAKALVDDVKPEFLRRFFVEEEGGYRVNKTLREMVLFARHNLIADPPFSRMDLISCRNLLIYLAPSLQQKVMPTLHYALNPGGFLMLGGSESISGFTELFEPLDKQHKIYSKKAAPTLAFHLPISAERGQRLTHARAPVPSMQRRSVDAPYESVDGKVSAQREADRLTLHRFAPPSVLVNAELQVVQFRGPTGAFLEPPRGRPNLDVLKMAKPGLMLPLRRLIDRAKKTGKVARKDDIRIRHDGRARRVSLEVVPLRGQQENCFLILFEDAGRPRGADASPESKLKSSRVDRPRGRDPSGRVASLEAELSETREYLQSVQEQNDAAHEELQSANEELQSANEELQSLNEELETSKEELESTNEELTTVNEEMANQNVELHRLNNDLMNLQASAKLPIVLLGLGLEVRRFSMEAGAKFGLRTADVGRSIGEVRHDYVVSGTDEPVDLRTFAGEVVSRLREQECEVRDREGRWRLLRGSPYMTSDRKVDGAVLMLIDIDTLKRSEGAAAHLAAIVSSSDDAIIGTDLRGVIQSWNGGAQLLYGYRAEEVLGRSAALLVPPELVDEQAGFLEQVGRGEVVGRVQTLRQRKDGTAAEVALTVSPIHDAQGVVIGTSQIAHDVSEHRRLERALRVRSAELLEADARKNEFLAMLGHELRNPLSALAYAIDLQSKVLDDRTKVEDLRAMMARQVTRIGSLLDQLLDLSRVIAGKVELVRERVDLAQVVRAAVETMRPLVESARHEVTLVLPTDARALVIGDAGRLTQVVENLLANAGKYTDAGGQIVVTLAFDGHKARIVVRDTGNGISPEFLPRIFDVFTQEPRTLERAKGGVGLGLALSRRLVEMHGGELTAASRGLGHGAEFTITLPLLIERRSGERADVELGATGHAKVRPRRILLVEDEQETARVLQNVLRLEGHETLVVHDGPTALANMRAFDPEVALLDIGLPGMDGYEVAKRIRQQERGDTQMLLLALTGYQRDIARLQQAGFDQHMLKPLNLKRLSRLLGAWDGGDRPVLAPD